MATVNLTDKFIRSMKPAPAEQYEEYWDQLVPGLILRNNSKGKKAWVVKKRWDGKNHSRRTMGIYGSETAGKALTLADARTKAREWIEMGDAGRDPKQEALAAAAAERAVKANTFSAVMDEYLKRHVKGQRKADQAEREMRKELLPVLKNRPITEITRSELVEIIDKIVRRGANYQAHNVWGHARSLFNWAIDSGYGLTVSPCWPKKPPALLSKANAKKSRQRVLTDTELKAFWEAAEATPYPYGPLFQLLLLTGQRRNDIGAARWVEVDAGKALLTVPEERYKSEVVHLVPLTDTAMSIIETLPRWVGEDTGDFLFSTTNGNKPVNGFSKAKLLLDTKVKEIVAKPHLEAKKKEITDKDVLAAKLKEIMDKAVPDWVIHDLRRTVRTRLGGLNVPEHISELVIGHARAGLAGVYDRHSYLEERRAALEKWERLLLSIVKPAQGSNVKPMRKTA